MSRDSLRRIQECSSEECLGDTLNAQVRLNSLNVFDMCIIIMIHATSL